MVCVIQMLHVQLQSGNLTFKHYFYEGRSEMIWTQLACGNFVIFRLNTEQLLAQHIPLLGLNIALGASRRLHGTILYGFCDTTHGQVPGSARDRNRSPHNAFLMLSQHCIVRGSQVR